MIIIITIVVVIVISAPFAYSPDTYTRGERRRAYSETRRVRDTRVHDSRTFDPSLKER